MDKLDKQQVQADVLLDMTNLELIYPNDPAKRWYLLRLRLSQGSIDVAPGLTEELLHAIELIINWRKTGAPAIDIVMDRIKIVAEIAEKSRKTSKWG